MGRTWYDSMQVKVTKEIFTRVAGRQQLHLGQGERHRIGLRQYFLPLASPDHRHLQLQQQQADQPQYVRPLATTITFSYTTPRFSADSKGMKAVSHTWCVTGNWARFSATRAAYRLDYLHR